MPSGVACLCRLNSDIEEYSAAATAFTDLGASTLSVTFLCLKKSQRSLCNAHSHTL